MQKFQQNVYDISLSQRSEHTQLCENEFNISFSGMTVSESIDSSSYSGKKQTNSISKFGFQIKNDSQSNNNQDSFYSECQNMKFDNTMDDELILQSKVDKRDIIFKTKHFKQSFIKYFIDVIYGFLKQPNDLSFAIALERIKYYTEQTPFLKRKSYFDLYHKQNQNNADTLNNNHQNYNTNHLFLSEKQKRNSTTSNCKTNQSSGQIKFDSNMSQYITVQELLKSMFYQNQHHFMIHTFDYNMCHLTFIAAMLYYWSRIDHPVSYKFSTFSRITLIDSHRLSSQKQARQLQQMTFKQNIFRTLKLYIQQRSQSLNINQINILIVYFFLNYLKSSSFCQQSHEDRTRQIQQIQQSFLNNLKLYRRIKKMQKQFNHTQNHIIFQSQLYKYEYENKLISSMEKTFQTFQLINTHNFVSSPFQKYYQLNQYQSSRKNYHLKRDCFCIWVLNIILRLCDKKSAQSLSKSSYYIITFLAILKKFKQNMNFEGISMILPILYNIKEQLPKVWSHTQSRRKQINQRLLQYSNILTNKTYKRQDIPKNCNGIISQDVIYQMCQRFCQYTKMHKDKSFDIQSYVNIQKHKKFYDQFLIHIIYHRKQILQQYSDDIQYYKRQKQIGISFNMYLLDTYVCRQMRGTNSKSNWVKLKHKSKDVNDQISCSIYIDIIDYCFVGSSLKCKQLDI